MYLSISQNNYEFAWLASESGAMQGLQGLHILLDGNLPWRQHMSPVRGLRQLGARAAWSHCPCFVLSLVLLVRSCQHILWLECMPCVTWHWKKWKTHLNIVRVNGTRSASGLAWRGTWWLFLTTSAARCGLLSSPEVVERCLSTNCFYACWVFARWQC